MRNMLLLLALFGLATATEESGGSIWEKAKKKAPKWISASALNDFEVLGALQTGQRRAQQLPEGVKMQAQFLKYLIKQAPLPVVRGHENPPHSMINVRENPDFDWNNPEAKINVFMLLVRRIARDTFELKVQFKLQGGYTIGSTRVQGDQLGPVLEELVRGGIITYPQKKLGVGLSPATSGETFLSFLPLLILIWVLFNAFACCCCRNVTKYTLCRCCCMNEALPSSVVDPNVVVIQKKAEKKKYPSRIPERAIPAAGTAGATSTEGKSVAPVLHSPFQAVAEMSAAHRAPEPQGPAPVSTQASVIAVEPLLIPEPMLIAPMEIDIAPFEDSDDEHALKSIKVDGQELINPQTPQTPSEPVTRANSLFCGDDKPGLSTRTSMASSHCPSVQAVKTWESEPVSEVGQPLRLPKRGQEADSLTDEDFSAVAVSVHENEASISAAVNEVSREGGSSNSVQVSVHENSASISAAVYDVSRDDDEDSEVPAPDPDFEVEISEHMNEASISAACYEGRDEL